MLHPFFELRRSESTTNCLFSFNHPNGTFLTTSNKIIHIRTAKYYIMGRRRRRQHDDDCDDTLERAFLAKRLKPEKDSSSRMLESNHSSDSQVNDEEDGNGRKNKDEIINIERLREKKRLKKLRQKEKKLAAKKEKEKLEALREKQRNERVKQKQQRKEQNEKEQRITSNSSCFVDTSMGVRYADIMVGKGPRLVDRKRVVCKYVLRAHNKKGKLLDSGERFTFRVGKGEVIRGWEIGLRGMRQGGLRHIIVPPKAGYGNKDIGGGKGAILYFEVTLLQC